MVVRGPTRRRVAKSANAARIIERHANHSQSRRESSHSTLFPGNRFSSVLFPCAFVFVFFVQQRVMSMGGMFFVAVCVCTNGLFKLCNTVIHNFVRCHINICLCARLCLRVCVCACLYVTSIGSNSEWWRMRVLALSVRYVYAKWFKSSSSLSPVA